MLETPSVQSYNHYVSGKMAKEEVTEEEEEEEEEEE